MLLDNIDDSAKFVRYIQLMGVKEENDHIGALGEPADHTLEIIPPVEPLFLPGEDPRGVDQRDALQDWAGYKRTFQPSKEVVAESLQTSKLVLRVHGQGVAGGYLLIWAVHDGHEPIRGGLRSNSDSRKVPFKQVPDEGGFPCRVLANQKHHWFGFKVTRIEVRGVKFTE